MYIQKLNKQIKCKKKINYFKNGTNKMVAEMAEIRPDLRASDARDTFADYWGNIVGIPLDNLAIMLGLSSTKEVKKYLNIRSNRIVEMLEKLKNN